MISLENKLITSYAQMGRKVKSVIKKLKIYVLFPF